MPTDSRSAIRYDGAMPDPAAVERALEVFAGRFCSSRLGFLAKKIGGIRSHALARQRRAGPSTLLGPGPSTSLGPGPMARPVSVTVTDLQVLGIAGPTSS